MTTAIDTVALRASFRDVLTAEVPLETALLDRAAMAGEATRLRGLVAELGWTGLTIGEAYQGLGLDATALAILLEECGRSLAPLAVLPSALAGFLLSAKANDAQRASYLPAIASGTTIAAVSPPYAVAGTIPALRTLANGRIALGGACDLIPAEAGSELLFVLARRDDGSLARIAIEPETDGVAMIAEPCWDRTRHLVRVVIDGAELPSDRLIEVDAAFERELLALAAIGTASDAVGATFAALELVIEYLKTRQQFGKPIGSFQALKHRVADHHCRIMAASALTMAAAAAMGTPDGFAQACAAKAESCTAFVAASIDAVQLHGGMGFTAEHPIHAFLQRARLDEASFGSTNQHLRLLSAETIAAVAA